jgi:hypothetical protein
MTLRRVVRTRDGAASEDYLGTGKWCTSASPTRAPRSAGLWCDATSASLPGVGGTDQDTRKWLTAWEGKEEASLAILVASEFMRRFLESHVPVRMGVGAGTFRMLGSSAQISDRFNKQSTQSLGSSVVRVFRAERCGLPGMNLCPPSVGTVVNLVNTIARRFEPWCQRYAQLSRELRGEPFLLTLPKRE